MKRIFFFATPSDIVPVLKKFESKSPLKFVQTGNLTTPNRPIYLNACEIPDAGIATHESAHASFSLMVSRRELKNVQRTFIGAKGEQRWTLDNSDNEESVILTLGGIWKTGTLLPGLMATLHETAGAQSLMKGFLSTLKLQGFVKVDLWWVGREAMAMLKAGKRLSTTAEQSPPEYDLKLPG